MGFLRKCFCWEERGRPTGRWGQVQNHLVRRRQRTLAETGSHQVTITITCVCMERNGRTSETRLLEGFRPAATARGTNLAPRDPFWAALQMAALGGPQPTLGLVGPGGLAGFTGHCGPHGKVSANSVTPCACPSPNTASCTGEPSCGGLPRPGVGRRPASGLRGPRGRGRLPVCPVYPRGAPVRAPEEVSRICRPCGPCHVNIVFFFQPLKNVKPTEPTGAVQSGV